MKKYFYRILVLLFVFGISLVRVVCNTLENFMSIFTGHHYVKTDKKIQTFWVDSVNFLVDRAKLIDPDTKKPTRFKLDAQDMRE
jgi:hypothetical protein